MKDEVRDKIEKYKESLEEELDIESTIPDEYNKELFSCLEDLQEQINNFNGLLREIKDDNDIEEDDITKVYSILLFTYLRFLCGITTTTSEHREALFKIYYDMIIGKNKELNKMFG